MLPTTKREAFIRDSAAAALGAFDIETLANKHGESVESAVALIDQNEAAVNREAAEMVADGRDVALIAKKCLSSALRQLAGQVDGENLSPALLLRTVEVLNKVSGLEAKQRVQPEEGSRFSITIKLPGQQIVLGNPPPVDIDGESELVDYD